MADEAYTILDDELEINFDPAFYVGQRSLGSIVQSAADEYLENISKAVEPFAKEMLRGIEARIDFDDEGGSFLWLTNPDINWATKINFRQFLLNQQKDEPEFFANLRGLLRSIDEERLGPP